VCLTVNITVLYLQIMKYYLKSVYIHVCFLMQLSTLFKSDMCKNVKFKIILACFRKVHLFRCVIIHEKYLIIILTVVCCLILHVKLIF